MVARKWLQCIMHESVRTPGHKKQCMCRGWAWERPSGSVRWLEPGSLCKAATGLGLHSWAAHALVCTVNVLVTVFVVSFAVHTIWVVLPMGVNLYAASTTTPWCLQTRLASTLSDAVTSVVKSLNLQPSMVPVEELTTAAGPVASQTRVLKDSWVALGPVVLFTLIVGGSRSTADCRGKAGHGAHSRQ